MMAQQKILQSEQGICTIKESIFSELHHLHGTTYSAVQYQLWAEMKVAPYPMFGEEDVLHLENCMTL